MTAKRVLITGAAGQLGQAVREILSAELELILTDIMIPPDLSAVIQPLDITDRAAVRRLITEMRPDGILNLAAMTDVDRCERHPRQAKKINCESVAVLRESFAGLIIHISTDYVFDGQAGPYQEDDPVHPLSVYGRTKRESELVLEDSGLPYLILRTNVVFDYTRTRASFVKWVVDSLREGKPIRVVDDQWNNPTWTHDLAEKLRGLILAEARGLYHYGGGDYLNRFRFAHLIAERFRLDKTLIQRIKTRELNQPAPRPLKGGLRTEKICRNFGFSPFPLGEALELIQQRIEK